MPSFLYQAPARFALLGQLLFLLGAIATVAGLVARLIVAVAYVGDVPVVPSLAAIYPDYPLWWVPEHAGGFILAIVIVSVGLWLASSSKVVLEQQARRNRRYHERRTTGALDAHQFW